LLIGEPLSRENLKKTGNVCKIVVLGNTSNGRTDLFQTYRRGQKQSVYFKEEFDSFSFLSKKSNTKVIIQDALSYCPTSQVMRDADGIMIVGHYGQHMFELENLAKMCRDRDYDAPILLFANHAGQLKGYEFSLHKENVLVSGNVSDPQHVTAAFDNLIYRACTPSANKPPPRESITLHHPIPPAKKQKGCKC
jgi:hypothetical protein